LTRGYNSLIVLFMETTEQNILHSEIIDSIGRSRIAARMRTAELTGELAHAYSQALCELVGTARKSKTARRIAEDRLIAKWIDEASI
jgi:hypothetical protein